jgi:hypothetical protein
LIKAEKYGARLFVFVSDGIVTGEITLRASTEVNRNDVLLD